MYYTITNMKDRDEVKKIYQKQFDHINKNLVDVEFAPYKSGTTKYLNILIAAWINNNANKNEEKENLLEHIITEKL